MGGRGDGTKSFNTIGKDGFARTATVLRPGKAIALNSTEPMKLVGHQKGDFIIHERGGDQAITHVPTGLLVTRVSNLKQAKSVVDDIQGMSSSLNRQGELARAQLKRGFKLSNADREENRTLRSRVETAVSSAIAKDTRPFKSTSRRSATESARSKRAKVAADRIDIG